MLHVVGMMRLAFPGSRGEQWLERVELPLVLRTATRMPR